MAVLITLREYKHDLGEYILHLDCMMNGVVKFDIADPLMVSFSTIFEDGRVREHLVPVAIFNDKIIAIGNVDR